MSRNSTAPEAQDAPWSACYWTSPDGLKIFYRDYAGPADRPPLLCLHGLTRNSRDFAALAGRYAGEFRIITMDFRGRGNSDRDPQPERYTPVTYAADVVGLLDHLQIPRAVFIGTSLGGLVTMMVAATHLERIAGALLNDIGPALEDAGLDRIRGYVGKGVDFANWSEAGAYVAGINNHLPAGNGPEDWIRAAQRLCREEGGRIVFDYDMAIARAFDGPSGGRVFDMWPLYRQLARKPLLIVRGEETDLLSPETAAAMQQAGDDVQLVSVPGVGHAPDLGEPEAVAAIDAFLRRFRS
ncbi:MAG TPA: alpha/beta hydrolase [Sphingomicrobium sp.]|nr:alpha/beta hydrolase [Sphingomicrobium sp.]